MANKQMAATPNRYQKFQYVRGRGGRGARRHRSLAQCCRRS